MKTPGYLSKTPQAFFDVQTIKDDKMNNLIQSADRVALDEEQPTPKRKRFGRPREILSALSPFKARRMPGQSHSRRRSETSASALGNTPVDKVTIHFKGNQPTVTMFIGKQTGREDRKLVLDAKTGALLRTEVYADKPFLNRLHSGEAFGDGGLVMAMLWGSSLALIASSGLIIYLKVLVRHPGHVTWLRRVFW